ncbi:MAG: hypothetical protein ACK5MT_18865 [Actinomycetales bacterium]
MTVRGGTESYPQIAEGGWHEALWPGCAVPVNRQTRAALAQAIAAEHDGVVHRRDLRAVGITHDDVRTEIRAGRWARAGWHTLVIGAGEPQGRGLLWRATWECGAGAVLDGAASLVAAGMTGFELASIDVCLPKNNRCHQVVGVRLRRTAAVPPLSGAGIPRVAPAWAAIRAAQRAVSDRQAALLLCLSVQQRLLHAPHLLDAWRQVSRSHRRAVIESVVQDLCEGAHSLGELDFAKLCRRHRLPAPTRQQVRHGPNGRVYLDVYFEAARLVVEVDGGHHNLGLNPVFDALRQNELTLGADRVLRIPLLGLRLNEADFMGQLRRALNASRL